MNKNPRFFRKGEARNAKSRASYKKYWSMIDAMPPLLHKPDREARYEPENSEVLAFIIKTCEVDLALAGKIMRSAIQAGYLVFDQETRLWSGLNRFGEDV